MIRQTWNVEDFLDNLFIYGMELILIIFILWSVAHELFTSDASNTESIQSQQTETSNP